jgi:hypothetical protein
VSRVSITFGRPQAHEALLNGRGSVTKFRLHFYVVPPTEYRENNTHRASDVPDSASGGARAHNTAAASLDLATAPDSVE